MNNDFKQFTGDFQSQCDYINVRFDSWEGWVCLTERVVPNLNINLCRSTSMVVIMIATPQGR